MSRWLLSLLTAGAVAFVALPPAAPAAAAAPGEGAAPQETAAPPSMPAGSGLYATYCTVCHGKDAKGTGPLASSLKRRPADLTAIAKNNGGSYPRDMVRRIIDGRKPVPGHGGGDMPVWGDAFERSTDAGPQAVNDRVDALVEYLSRIQVQ